MEPGTFFNRAPQPRVAGVGGRKRPGRKGSKRPFQAGSRAPEKFFPPTGDPETPTERVSRTLKKSTNAEERREPS